MSSVQLSRRRFVQGLLAAGALTRVRAFAQTAQGSSDWVLLGTQNGDGIYRAPWNSTTGVLGEPTLAVSTSRPTYLALHPHLPVVYACNENDGDAATVSAFAIDRKQVRLEPLGSQQTRGGAPCFGSVDRTGKLLFAANYGGGSLATFALEPEGKLAVAADVFSCHNSKLCGSTGPIRDRQDAPHLHCAVISPDNRFVLACDLGDDAILAFPIHPGQTPPIGQPQRVPARRGSGPRHLAFHPNGRWLYCIHELDCTVDMYTWRSNGSVAEAQLVPQTTVSLASPAPVDSKPNTGAEIVITRDGRFLYTSTRGVDVLTSFRINETTGKLTQIQQLPCGGRTPRFFALDPSERWLLCANQDSDAVTIFARDRSSGVLKPSTSTAAASPMCIVWL